MYTRFGYYKVCAASPKLEVANPYFNIDEIIKLTKEAANRENALIVFPETSVTSYTAEDLFHSSELLDQTKDAVLKFLDATKNAEIVSVIGLPYQCFDGRIYNAAMVTFKGKILGMVPKQYLPNYGEFYDDRYFTSGIGKEYQITDFNQTFLFSTKQLFKIKEMVLGVEICEDLWSTNPPSNSMCSSGCNVVANLSASNELVGKYQYRKDLIAMTSSRLNSAYVYAGASSCEETKDTVFGGHCIIAENGTVLKESGRFNFESEIIEVEIDINKLQMERRKNSTFQRSEIEKMTIHNVDFQYKLSTLTREYTDTPFIPKGGDLDARVKEILMIQTTGLMKRMKATGIHNLVLGLSGGLDSTLTAIVCREALKRMNLPVTNLITLSMPGFGTSDRTRGQSKRLAAVLGSTFREIDITKAVSQHFEDIGQDPKKYDITFENAQARERTQILFDVANMEGGFNVGTGSLSEAAVGYATFNADNISSYNVNASIPKSLIQYIVRGYAQSQEDELKDVLIKIVETKMSAELIPQEDKKSVGQSTEAFLGPYHIIDFVIFHLLRNGFSREKIELLTDRSFKGLYDQETIDKTVKTFFNRFESNQFKRTTTPPGPKVGSVSLSPRADWRMPDTSKLWKKS